jgi:hypothetical protein
MSIEPAGADLDRVRDLCADLAGAADGELLAWAGPGDVDAVAAEVFGVVTDAGLLADADPRHPVSVPADGDALMSRMWELDEPAAVELLASLCDSTRSNRPRRRRLRRGYQDDAQDIFAEMASLFGSGARWWTNTDLTTWNPITQHTFDAIIVGAGNGLIVTVIAFEGGELRQPDKWSRDRLMSPRYPDSPAGS